MGDKPIKVRLPVYGSVDPFVPKEGPTKMEPLRVQYVEMFTQDLDAAVDLVNWQTDPLPN